MNALASAPLWRPGVYTTAESVADVEQLDRQGLATQFKDGPEVSLEELRWEFLKVQMAAGAEMLASQGEACQVERIKGIDGHTQEVPEQDDPYAYILSTTKARGYVTLHKNGGCHRKPFIHLRQVQFVRSVEDGDFHSRCKDCFRVRKVAAGPVSVSDIGAVEALEQASVHTESEEESGSTESDDSSGVQSSRKKPRCIDASVVGPSASSTEERISIVPGLCCWYESKAAQSQDRPMEECVGNCALQLNDDSMCEAKCRRKAGHKGYCYCGTCELHFARDKLQEWKQKFLGIEVDRDLIVFWGGVFGFLVEMFPLP